MLLPVTLVLPSRWHCRRLVTPVGRDFPEGIAGFYLGRQIAASCRPDSRTPQSLIGPTRSPNRGGGFKSVNIRLTFVRLARGNLLFRTPVEVVLISGTKRLRVEESFRNPRPFCRRAPN